MMNSTLACTTAFSPIDGPNGYDSDEPLARVLSFGVELEFSILTLKAGQKDPNPKDDRIVYGIVPPTDPQRVDYQYVCEDRVKEHLANNLNETFNALEVQSTKSTVAPQQFWAFGGNIKGKGSRNPDGSERTPLGEWIITQDPSIIPPKHPVYEFFPIEVNSPAFLFSEAAVYQVQEVVAHLNNTYRININETCGLHLHIGSKHAGFSFPHLRKICAVFWTFEPCFYYLANESRWANDECPFMTQKSNLMQLLRAEGKSHSECLQEGLEMILSTSSVDELINLLTWTEHRLGFNLRNLYENPPHGFPEKAKRTIEVRFHEGSLDPQDIYHWTHLFHGFIQFAEYVNTSSLEKWLREHTRDTENNPFQLLNALKLHHQAWYYEIKTKHRWSKTGKVDLSAIIALATKQL
ncbi:uncharacterized protein PAC_06369 [Phialocephala subalpina]|uniref:Amidoligase enzyme n=1 Tax=Phialocephala subalpina TaxID=576137 RepID=A0A1L7WUM8_9HELO|nr:uncharacterized protein PAC_06369 [Phialocephala subalpina]